MASTVLQGAAGVDEVAATTRLSMRVLAARAVGRATDAARYAIGWPTRVAIQRRSTMVPSRIGIAPSMPPTGELSPDAPGACNSIR